MSGLTNALRHARPLLAATAAAAALCAVPMSAAYADYPPPGVPGTISSGTVQVNGNVKFGGSGFDAKEDIDVVVEPASTAPSAAPAAGAATAHVQLIAFYSTSASAVTAASSMSFTSTVKADKSGSFSTSVHLTTAGTYWLVATGRTSNHVVSATVKVLAQSNGNGTPAGGKGGGGGLSFTGAPVNFATVAWLGVGAISLGIAFLRLGATRRRQEALVEPSVSGL